MSKIAHIIAIRTASLGDLGFGITDHPDAISHVLDEGEVWVGPRQNLELNFDFVQPIPYIILRDGDRVLCYERGTGGGEGRLFDKVSIGFGGHVDGSDAVYQDDGVIDLRATMLKACIRELEEELGIRLNALEVEALLKWTHVISSDATSVDEVHIGLVASLNVRDLPAIDPAQFEEVIENARWMQADGLVTDHAAGLVKLETWTALALSRPFVSAA